MSLLDSAGKTVAHEQGQRAGRPAVPRGQAGRRLPRRARQPAATVRAADGAHRRSRRRRAPSVYDQAIPSSGYGYLTTRDGTKLALLRPPAAGRRERAAAPAVPPPDVGRRPVPDADRVLGLRLRRPGRPAERHRDPRQPHGLHGRRREHARHRLLGRRVRLLRAAAEPRRLRRRSRRSRASRGSRTTRSG